MSEGYIQTMGWVDIDGKDTLRAIFVFTDTPRGISFGDIWSKRPMILVPAPAPDPPATTRREAE